MFGVGEVWENRIIIIQGIYLSFESSNTSLIIRYCYTGICIIFSLHTILILRLYGLYGCKKLMYALLLLLGSTTAAELYIALSYAPHSTTLSLGLGVGGICQPDFLPKLTLIW